jgi:hypothetical protein
MRERDKECYIAYIWLLARETCAVHSYQACWNERINSGGLPVAPTPKEKGEKREEDIFFLVQV